MIIDSASLMDLWFCRTHSEPQGKAHYDIVQQLQPAFCKGAHAAPVMQRSTTAAKNLSQTSDSVYFNTAYFGPKTVIRS